jgi:hypothetical protein
MREDPVTLRVYNFSEREKVSHEINYVPLEKTFHELLASAGTSKTTAHSEGTEWFVTTLEFLD